MTQVFCGSLMDLRKEHRKQKKPASGLFFVACLLRAAQRIGVFGV